MNPELTIIIPAKNEEAYIGKLLDSILCQDYPQIYSTQIFVADANSTDKTREVVSSYGKRSNIKIIPGGLPAAGRNAGAKLATTKYIILIDADITLADKATIQKVLHLANAKSLDLVTTHIRCSNGNFLEKSFYRFNSSLQYLSKFTSPYSTGMFMLWDRQAFLMLGGFDERILFAEDFFLSRQVPNNKFGMARVTALTTNRRFQTMSYWKLSKLWLTALLCHKNPRYFYKDRGYWK